MMEERQQNGIEACKDMAEGDSCILESPMGEMEGVCTTIEDNLMCMGNRAMNQR